MRCDAVRISAWKRTSGRQRAQEGTTPPTELRFAPQGILRKLPRRRKRRLLGSTGAATFAELRMLSEKDLPSPARRVHATRTRRI
mmetsp:Transcript_58198/g.162270  ORF Transcript_58198/g.162270 Transcript_58198/m.162270 type:complete len:85 (-) Transcript_58198:13-267(-)